mmetsp:Transcript_17024/g.43173  ORF Transcript_17024/g.43173 Transcript_17024/m.43173 type:complete len:627 (+) Transcript_17024:360-2240(+)
MRVPCGTYAPGFESSAAWLAQSSGRTLCPLLSAFTSLPRAVLVRKDAAQPAEQAAPLAARELVPREALGAARMARRLDVRGVAVVLVAQVAGRHGLRERVDGAVADDRGGGGRGRDGGARGDALPRARLAVDQLAAQLGRHALQHLHRVAVDREHVELGAVDERRGQTADLVAAAVQLLQLGAVPDALRQRRHLVVVQPEALEDLALADGGGDGGDVVVVDPKVLQLQHVADGVGQLRDVVAHEAEGVAGGHAAEEGGRHGGDLVGVQRHRAQRGAARHDLRQRPDLLAVQAEPLHVGRHRREVLQLVGVEAEPAQGGDGGELGADGVQVAVVEREVVQHGEGVAVEIVRQHLDVVAVALQLHELVALEQLRGELRQVARADVQPLHVGVHLRLALEREVQAQLVLDVRVAPHRPQVPLPVLLVPDQHEAPHLVVVRVHVAALEVVPHAAPPHRERAVAEVVQTQVAQHAGPRVREIRRRVRLALLHRRQNVGVLQLGEAGNEVVAHDAVVDHVQPLKYRVPLGQAPRDRALQVLHAGRRHRAGCGLAHAVGMSLRSNASGACRPTRARRGCAAALYISPTRSGRQACSETGTAPPPGSAGGDNKVARKQEMSPGFLQLLVFVSPR